MKEWGKKHGIVFERNNLGKTIELRRRGGVKFYLDKANVFLCFELVKLVFNESGVWILSCLDLDSVMLNF